MTREEARKAAEVMLAYVNGEEIEYTVKGCNNWMKVDSPSFNWDWEYRIKPKQPKFDPKTLQPFDKVLGRDADNEMWTCNLFSHITNVNRFPYVCVCTSYTMAIPYNEETKHLVGTTEEAPEFYRYWED